MNNDERKKLLEQIIADSLRDYSRMVLDDPTIVQAIQQQFERNAYFGNLGKHAGYTNTPEEDKKYMGDAAQTIISRRKGKILVFGSTEFTKKVSDSLEKCGFSYYHATDVDEAMDFIENETPPITLVESDSQMGENLRIESERYMPASDMTIIPAAEADFKAERIIPMIALLDSRIEACTRKRSEEKDMVIVSETPPPHEFIDILRAKGFRVGVCPTEEDAEKMYPFVRLRYEIPWAEINENQRVLIVDELKGNVSMSRAREILSMVEKGGGITPTEIVHNETMEFGSQLKALEVTVQELSAGDAGKSSGMSRIVIIDSGQIGKGIADSLRDKGYFDARYCPTAEEAAEKFSDIPFRVDLGTARGTGLTNAEKQFLLEEIGKGRYGKKDILRVITHLRDKKPIVDLPALAHYIREMREFRDEQYIMRLYCIHNGNIGMIKSDGTGAVVDRLSQADLNAIVSRNALQSFLNRGTTEDLHNRLISRAFGGGYSDLFMLEEGKKQRIKPEELLTDDSFNEFLLQRVIEYIIDPKSAAPNEFLSADELEALKHNLESQLNVADDNDRAKKLKSLQEYINRESENYSGAAADGRRVYMRLSFPEMINLVGGLPKAKEKRKELGKKVAAAVGSYIRDESFGPSDVGSLVRREYKVHCPSRNPVFRVEVSVMDLGSIDTIAKIFDYRRDASGRQLTETEKKKKRQDFKKEVAAADYYSRWGINKAVHFFFEEYEEFGAIMMRYWGENNLFDVITELNEIMKDEESRKESADPGIIARWRMHKETIFTNLMKRMAEVNAYSPHSSTELSDSTEDFSYSLKHEVFVEERQDCISMLAPLRKYCRDVSVIAEAKHALKKLRRYSGTFADYITKAPFSREKVACKDAALRNWFLPSFWLGDDIKPGDIQPIDYGTIRQLPPQMDVGNAFVMGGVVTLDEIIKYSKVYFEEYDEEIRLYNQRLDEILENVPAEVKKQFGREDLCRKSARKYLKGFYSIVERKVDEMVKAKGGRIPATQKGTSVITKAIDEAYFEYINGDSAADSGSPVPEEHRQHLQLFKDNIIRYFRGLKKKNRYLKDEYTPGQNEARFNVFWEGMVASMAYKTMRNLRAYSGFMMGIREDSDGTQGSSCEQLGIGGLAEMAHEASVMASEGMVKNMERLLEIYQMKIGTKVGKYVYARESYEKMEKMVSELNVLAECFRKFEQGFGGSGNAQ